jgi:hypothetical protein
MAPTTTATYSILEAHSTTSTATTTVTADLIGEAPATSTTDLVEAAPSANNTNLIDEAIETITTTTDSIQKKAVTVSPGILYLDNGGEFHGKCIDLVNTNEPDTQNLNEGLNVV